MALDTRGFYPDNTPNPALGQISNTLTENIRYKQEKNYRNQKDKEAKAAQNRLLNLREIDQDTDAAKFKTGEERFDNYAQKELSNIKNKALTEYINLDPVEVEYRLGKDMQGFVGWHNAVKSNIDKIKTGLADFNKTYPNINAQKAHEMAYLELGNDFLEKDEEGNVVRKDPSLAKSRDYISELNSPDKLGEIVEDVTPFAKYIQSFKPQKSGAKEYQSKRGYAVKHGYTAEITPFSEIETNEDGKPIGVKLQSEDFKYDGGTLKMLPERQFEQMMEVPQVRASIIGMWSKHKKQFEEETGQKITPANEDKMLRGFLYDEIKNNNLDQHFFKTDDAIVTPRITVNTGSGSGSTTINDVYGEIEGAIGDKGVIKVSDLSSDAVSYLVGEAKKSADKEENVSSENLVVGKEPDGRIAYYVTRTDGTNTRIGYLTKKGTNLKVQPGVKEKREVISKGNATQSNKSSGGIYEVGGKKYSESDLLKLKYTKDQIEQAVKNGRLKRL